MDFETNIDRRRMLPGPEGSQYWPPTAWYREAIDVLTEYAESGERLLSAGSRLATRDYFTLTSLSRQIVAIRDTRDERNQVRSRDTGDVNDFGC